MHNPHRRTLPAAGRTDPRSPRRAAGHAALLGLLALAVLHTAAAQAADLTVVVSNIQSTRGPIRVGVFKDPATFPKADQILVGKAVAATPQEVTVVFAGLAPGTYAVSAYQDLDDNGKLNRNLFGVPSEPYGFSRGARGRTGPPSFDDAKVDVGASGARVVFEVK